MFFDWLYAQESPRGTFLDSLKWFGISFSEKNVQMSWSIRGHGGFVACEIILISNNTSCGLVDKHFRQIWWLNMKNFPSEARAAILDFWSLQKDTRLLHNPQEHLWVGDWACSGSEQNWKCEKFTTYVRTLDTFPLEKLNWSSTSGELKRDKLSQNIC